jgi:hypothetical protein
MMKYLAGAMAAVTLTVAACGGDDEVTTAAAPDETEAEAPATEPERSTTEAPDTTDAPERTTPPTTAIDCPTGERRTPVNTCVPDTTAAPEEGTRTNPFPVGAPLTTDDFDFTVGPLEPADCAALGEFNQEECAVPGTALVRTMVNVTYKGDDTLSGTSFSFSLKVTGAKSKIYDTLYVYDQDGTFGLLTDQPDVIAGGTIAGALYYLVDADDTGLLYLWDGGFEPQYLATA